jgi:hypothetical protein
MQLLMIVPYSCFRLLLLLLLLLHPPAAAASVFPPPLLQLLLLHAFKMSPASLCFVSARMKHLLVCFGNRLLG